MRNKQIDKYFAASIILLSGNYPYITLFEILSNTEMILIHLLMFIFLKKININNLKLNRKFFLIMLTFIVLIIVQHIYFAYKFDNTILYQALLVIYAYLIVTNINIDISIYYAELIKTLIKFSLIFWSISCILKYFDNDIRYILPNSLFFPINSNSEIHSHLLVHNFASPEDNNESIIIRNSGMFWEPGAFAGIIIFGFIFFLLSTNKINRKQHIVFLAWFTIGIITTQSTTGYLIIFLLIIIYKLQNSLKYKNRIYNYLILYLPLSLIVVALISLNMPFVGDKILLQLNILNDHEIGWESTRIGTIFFLTNIIENNPLIGIGFNIAEWKATLKSHNISSGAELGNGMFIFIAKIGIPYFILLIYIMYYSINKITKKTIISLTIIFVILLLLQGESWFIYPVIYTLLFINNSKTLNFNYISETNTSYRQII